MASNDGNIVKRTSQYIDNIGFDENTLLPMVEIVGTDGSTFVGSDGKTYQNQYKVGVGPTGALVIGGNALALRLDTTTTANVTYVGKAAISTATSAALWQIQKIDETTGLVITWADGDSNFNNVWDNRASLTYS